MRSVLVTFPNPEGNMLAARISYPVDGEPLAYALFAHCFTCTKNLKAISNIARSLTQDGIAVMSFDFTGLGESEGDFGDTNFSSNVDDLVCAAEYLSENHMAPGILIGHSLGGAAVLKAAARIPAAKAIATIGAPSDPEHITKLLEDSREEIEATGQARVNLAGRVFTIKKQFLDDLQEASMERTIHDLRKPLLIMHAPLDKTVGVDNAAKIFQAALHPKSFISLDEADHLLMREADSRYAGRMIGTWAARYLGDYTEKLPQVDLEDNRITVRNGDEGFLSQISANGHHLLSDEPEKVGGTNLGPTPYDLLVSGLGACTAMTLRVYAKRKNWDLGEVVVRLEHSKVHETDLEECEQPKRKVDFITRHIEIKGDLDDQQRKRLLEIADKCPVHRTLESVTRIETSMAEE